MTHYIFPFLCLEEDPLPPFLSLLSHSTLSVNPFKKERKSEGEREVSVSGGAVVAVPR